MEKSTLAKFAGVYSGLVFGIYWLPLRQLQEAGFQGLWGTTVFNLTPLLLLVPLIAVRLRILISGGVRFHCCGVLMGLAYMLYASSFLYTDVVRAILLFYLMPIWGFLLARLVTGDPITLPRWLSMVLGLLGLLVILGIDVGFPLPHNVGDWMALGSGITWSIASVMLLIDTRNAVQDYVILFFFWASVIALSLALIATQQGQLASANWAILGVQLYWLAPLAIVVLIPTAIATIFAPFHLNAGIAGLLFMTEISVGVATAALFSGEPFGWREAIGVCLITLAGFMEPLFGFFGTRRCKIKS